MKTIFEHIINLEMTQAELGYIIKLIKEYIIRTENITEIRVKLPLLDYLEQELNNQNLSNEEK